MTRKVLCFGSKSVRGDDVAFGVMRKIGDKMEGMEFVKCDSPIDIMAHINDDEIFVMDAVRGLDSVCVFSKAEDFTTVRSSTSHDMDLGTFLQVLEGMGWTDKLRIVGIPMGSNVKKASDEVMKLLAPKPKVKEMR